MKKILLCFAALLFLNAVKAQTFCPPGATWYFYKQGFMAGVDGVLELSYTSDVQINNITCKKISGTFTGKTMSTGSVVTTIPDYKTYYIYENNQVVYLYNGSTFDTVVNYHAAIGDKWLRPQINSSCNSRQHVTVTDTGRMAINGFNLKKIATTYTSSYIITPTTYTFSGGNIFVERVNMFSGCGSGSDLFPNCCEVDNLIAEFPMTTFRCYQDNAFPLYTTISAGCNSITGIRNISGSLTGVALYPNPATDQLIIDKPTSRIYKAKLTDLLGNTVLESAIEIQGKTQLDITGLNTGVYILHLFDNGQLAGSEKIIKN